MARGRPGVPSWVNPAGNSSSPTSPETPLGDDWERAGPVGGVSRMQASLSRGLALLLWGALALALVLGLVNFTGLASRADTSRTATNTTEPALVPPPGGCAELVIAGWLAGDTELLSGVAGLPRGRFEQGRRRAGHIYTAAATRPRRLGLSDRRRSGATGRERSLAVGGPAVLLRHHGPHLGRHRVPGLGAGRATGRGARTAARRRRHTGVRGVAAGLRDGTEPDPDRLLQRPAGRHGKRGAVRRAGGLHPHPDATAVPAGRGHRLAGSRRAAGGGAPGRDRGATVGHGQHRISRSAVGLSGDGRSPRRTLGGNRTRSVGGDRPVAGRRADGPAGRPRELRHRRRADGPVDRTNGG